MKNIDLNFGGFIGVLVCGGIAAAIIFPNVDPMKGGRAPYKLFIVVLIAGGFAGNFLWGLIFDTSKPGGSNGDREIVVGGLYASQHEDGLYSVMKVLVVDDFAVHLRAYSNRFDALPMDIDPLVLTLGGVSDGGPLGIGHFPIAREGFWNGGPVFLRKEPVADDELEGYRYYLEAMSGSE